MRKFRLLTISMITAGAVVAASMALADPNQPAPKGPSLNDIGNDINSSGAQISKNISSASDNLIKFLTHEMYKADKNLSAVMVFVQQSLSAAQSSVRQSSQTAILQASGIGKLVMAANTKNKDQNASIPLSPAGGIASYNANVAAGDKYSYMQLLNTDVSGASSAIKTGVTKDACLNTYLGHPQAPNGSKLWTTSGTTKVSCSYNPKLLQAINYIHTVAGYNQPMSSVSGQNKVLWKLKGNYPVYNNAVKSLVAGRSVGESALYDLLQGRIAAKGGKSLVAINQQRYAYRASSPQWHMNIAASSAPTAAREQDYMLADIEKELGTLIQLQRKQYALSAINEMQMTSLANQSKLQGVLSIEKAKAASANATASLKKKK